MSPSVRAPSPRQVFLILSATRWLPVGLVASLPPLLALERGLTAQEALTYAAAQGAAVVLLELPTSGFSDAFGRKPVLVAAALVAIAATLAYLMAGGFWGFVLAAALSGAYRALDSGPLEAWYVDRVHADARARGGQGAALPDVTGDLAAQSTVVGVALAGGALVAGGLIVWHPIAARSALVLPLLASLALSVLHLGATALLLPSEGAGGGWGAAVASARDTPRLVGEGLRLLGRSRVLAALVGVELFWCAAVVAGESMVPIRLTELLGDPDRAGAWVAPATAAAWGAFAGGAALVGRLSARIGAARSAILARVMHGLAVAGLGVLAGPAGLVAGYLLAFGCHGVANPPHAALLHREASSGVRATVLSLNSLAFMGGLAVAGPALGWVAGAWSTQAAMVAGGLWSLIGAALYLPALRRG